MTTLGQPTRITDDVKSNESIINFVKEHQGSRLIDYLHYVGIDNPTKSEREILGRRIHSLVVAEVLFRRRIVQDSKYWCYIYYTSKSLAMKEDKKPELINIEDLLKKEGRVMTMRQICRALGVTEYQQPYIGRQLRSLMNFGDVVKYKVDTCGLSKNNYVYAHKSLDFKGEFMFLDELCDLYDELWEKYDDEKITEDELKGELWNLVCIARGEL